MGRTRLRYSPRPQGGSGGWVDPACDAAGNQTFGPQPGAEATATEAHHYVYDAWNRLVEVWEDADGDETLDDPGDTAIQACRYDGLGRRIQKIDKTGASDVTCDYYYNTGWQVVEVRRNADTDPYKQYVWDLRYIDAPVLRWRDTGGDGDLDETLYFCNDANMNVTALVEPDGDVVERVVYDPYGKPTFCDADWANPSPSSAYANEVLYCGYRYDSETGLYHVRHRSYHPTLGRWMQRDPVGYAETLSLYAYVSAAPANRLDPDGTRWVEADSRLTGSKLRAKGGPGAGRTVPKSTISRSSAPGSYTPKSTGVWQAGAGTALQLAAQSVGNWVQGAMAEALKNMHLLQEISKICHETKGTVHRLSNGVSYGYSDNVTHLKTPSKIKKLLGATGNIVYDCRLNFSINCNLPKPPINWTVKGRAKLRKAGAGTRTVVRAIDAGELSNRRLICACCYGIR